MILTDYTFNERVYGALSVMSNLAPSVIRNMVYLY